MPKLKLTLTSVAKIPLPQSGQVIYWDESPRGFGLRVTPSRKTYIAECRVDGKTVRVKIGPHGPFTPDTARDQALKLLADMNRGINPNALKAKQELAAITLSEVFAEFKQCRTLRPKTVTIYDDVMRRCFADWQDLPVTGISKNMVEQRHREISNKNGPRGKGEAQAHQAMRTLGTVLNFAAVKYEDPDGKPLLSSNPVKRLSEVRAWNHIPRRQSVIQSHQLKAWAKAVAQEDEKVRDYLFLLLLTGLRRNEAAALLWADVDLEAKTLRIPGDRTKNHHEHRLPLSDFILAMFKRRKVSRIVGNPHVFPGVGRTGHLVEPKRHIKRVVSRSGVKFSLHDLRRTFLSVAEALDISHYALKQLANHKSSSDVTQGYIVNDVERLREPMQRVTDFILNKADMHQVKRLRTKNAK